MLAPVIVFAYNREVELKQSLEALDKNNLAPQTDLFIYVDGPKREGDVAKVDKVIDTVQLFQQKSCFKKVQIHISQKNKGLANSIISGVTEVLHIYKKAIILEDDLITSKDFLDYMNTGLDFYERDITVGAISGFTPINVSEKECPMGIYKSKTGNSCGWATWESIWGTVDWNVSDYFEFKNSNKMRKEFNKIQYGIMDILDRQMSGKLDSWAVRWDYHFFKHQLWTIYPSVSKIQNVGFGKDGTTCHNEYDKRRKVECQDSVFTMTEISKLKDMTKETAADFKPSIHEKIIDMIQVKLKHKRKRQAI